MHEPRNSAPESSYRDHEQSARSVSGLGFAILTLSDSRTEETDKSGRFLRETLQQAGHVLAHYGVLPDDMSQLRATLRALLDRGDVHVIVTNGGTGISARDSTCEVVTELLEKTLDGFGELFRMLSYEEIGAAAMLSRAVGGIVRGRVVFALPGSTNAVRLGFEKLILPQVAHLYRELHKHDA